MRDGPTEDYQLKGLARVQEATVSSELDRRIRELELNLLELKTARQAMLNDPQIEKFLSGVGRMIKGFL